MPVNHAGSTAEYRNGTVDAPVCSQIVDAAGASGEGIVLSKTIAAQEFVDYYGPKREPRLRLRL